MPEDLTRLTDDELLGQLQLATRGERRMTIRVLHHLNEMERRGIHLDAGYSSLFDYCIRKLKYSPSAAGRRIQTARCIRRFPRVLGLLESHELSLSVVALIEPVLTPDNCEWMLERVRGCSHREVHRIVSEFRPPVAFRDRVMPVRVNVPVADADATLFEREIARQVPHAQPVTIEDRLIVQFLADEELMRQFEEAKALLSRRGNNPSFADVLKTLLAEFLDRHRPAARQARRAAKKRAVSPDSRRREWNNQSRHIPDDVRDQVYMRDRGRCSFVARDGTRCRSRHGLQVDHIRPFSTGGDHDVDNLRLLCAAHNRRAAEKTLGTNLMQRFYPRE